MWGVEVEGIEEVKSWCIVDGEVVESVVERFIDEVVIFKDVRVIGEVTEDIFSCFKEVIEEIVSCLIVDFLMWWRWIYSWSFVFKENYSKQWWQEKKEEEDEFNCFFLTFRDVADEETVWVITLVVDFLIFCCWKSL